MVPPPVDAIRVESVYTVQCSVT